MILASSRAALAPAPPRARAPRVVVGKSSSANSSSRGRVAVASSSSSLAAARRAPRGFAPPRAAANEPPKAPGFEGAPMDPGSPQGQLLAHVLDNEPQLFDAAVEATLDRLCDEIDDAESASNGVIDVTNDDGDGNAADRAAPKKGGELVLFRRIQEMRAMERRSGVQDVMYAQILQKFMTIGVDMLPPLDDTTLIMRGVDLNQLTKGVHSVEALEMVKEHLLGMLGPEASTAYSNTMVRMSKLQAAQMYAASIMFGYFLRRADKRFSLDRAMGTLPMNPMESAAALEALFNSASAMDSMDEADVPFAGASEFPGSSGPTFDVASNSTDDDAATATAAGAGAAGGGSTTLKQYIQSFDQQALSDTARIVSLEGVVLAERQTGALFGSVEDLAMEMKEALESGGVEINSADELMSRVQEVVGAGKVKTLTVPVATQRRIVLEAVAFGSFLRDVESGVDARDGRLLTPAPSAGRGREPPGLIGGAA